jgi:hypothetical protein
VLSVKTVKRKQIDREAIERDYRTGALKLRQLAGRAMPSDRASVQAEGVDEAVVGRGTRGDKRRATQNNTAAGPVAAWTRWWRQWRSCTAGHKRQADAALG